jgi:hypothetical protein
MNVTQKEEVARTIKTARRGAQVYKRMNPSGTCRVSAYIGWYVLMGILYGAKR